MTSALGWGHRRLCIHKLKCSSSMIEKCTYYDLMTSWMKVLRKERPEVEVLNGDKDVFDIDLGLG